MALFECGVCLRRPVLILCFSPGVIPDESKALSLLAPANAVAGCMPGGGLLPTPNPLASVSVSCWCRNETYQLCNQRPHFDNKKSTWKEDLSDVYPLSLQMGGVPLSALGNPNMDHMAAMGMSGNINPQVGHGYFLFHNSLYFKTGVGYSIHL